MRPWLLVLALAAFLVAGCRLAGDAPDLLTVLDVVPDVVDVGDRVEVVGTGFPEGRVGTVTLRGQLHRPGQSAMPISATLRAASTSRNRIAFDVTEELQRELCGSGRDAGHTTFRGELQVAFSPREAGAPPITGRLHDVVLDLTSPLVEPPVRAERVEAGQRAVEFLGATIDQQGARRLVLTEIQRAGRADRAGLLAKDRLLSFNGVVVHDVSDLVPAAGQRLVTVSVQRGRLEDPVVRMIDVDGFAPAAPEELTLATMLVGFVAAVMLLFVAPIGRLLTWAERRVAGRLRDAATLRRRTPRTRLGWIAHAASTLATERLWPAGGGYRLLGIVPYLQFLAVSAWLTLVVFGSPLVAEDLDLPLALLASTTALAAIGLVLGGWRGARRWSLIAGLRSALLLLLFQLPAIGVFCTVVFAGGSSRAVDLVVTQGALPWEWRVFTNPLMLLGLFAILVAAVPETSRASLELPEADPRRGATVSEPNSGSRCLMFFAQWGHVWVVSGLASLLLLGGWNVPGIELGPQSEGTLWLIVGAGVVQVKCWALVLLVRAARWMLPRLSLEQMSGLFWRWMAPVTVALVGLTVGWSWGQADAFVRSLQQRASMVLFAVTLFVAAYLVVRVLTNLHRRSVQLNVNPWL